MYLNATLLFPPQLDLAKLSLPDGIAEYVFAKPDVLLSFRMVVSTPSTTARLFPVVSRCHNGGGGRFIVGRGSVLRSRHCYPLLFPFNVDLLLGDEHTVQDFARLARRAFGRGRRASGPGVSRAGALLGILRDILILPPS